MRAKTRRRATNATVRRCALRCVRCKLKEIHPVATPGDVYRLMEQRGWNLIGTSGGGRMIGICPTCRAEKREKGGECEERDEKIADAATA